MTGLCHFCLYEKTFFVKHQPRLYLVDVWYQTSTKTLPGWCLIANVNQNCIWLMFDIKCQPELYLVDVWYQSSIGWLLVHDWYSYTLVICFLCISGYVDYKKGIQFWHFFDWTLSFLLVWKNIFRQTSNRTVPGWCLISNVNQNSTWLMFDSKCQPELHLVDVWFQMSTRTASGWCLISIINRWLLVHDWYSYTLGVCFLCISGYLDSNKGIQLWHFLTWLCHFCLYEKTFFVKHQPRLYLVDVWYQTSTKTLPGWCLIANVNQNCIWLMFDIKCQPELYLVGVWYQSSIGWLLVHDWYSYTLGICFLCISGYVDSKNGIQFWHFFWLDFVIFACMKKHFRQTSTKTVPSWCLISNVNQNSTWLMFDIKRQPKLYLVDVWHQMSTRTLSGWCLISIINRVATGSWLIFIYYRYMFSLHFRVCRFQKRYTILTLFWLDFVIFACMKKYFSSNINQNCTWLIFDIKRQPKLYLVDVWHQTSTKTLSGWCLISNVNQNSIWLMFDINHQSGGYWFIIELYLVDCHFCLYEKTFFVKHQPKLYLVDVWYQTSTKTLPGWCLISNVNQNSTWLMFDIKHQPKLYLVDVWYQSSIGGYWFMIDIHIF